MEPATSTHHTTTGLNHKKLLMWAFLGSDCMFFGSLIATYLIYQSRSIVGPIPADILDIPVTSVSTFVLLMSSFMMVLSYNAIGKGDMRRFRIWVMGTILMGCTFLGFQVYEFREFALHGLNPRTNLYGSTFFTLTGFHGAHVTLGVIWLASLFWFSYKDPETLKKDHGLSVALAALYWHFVDGIWVILFIILYLL